MKKVFNEEARNLNNSGHLQKRVEEGLQKCAENCRTQYWLDNRRRVDGKGIRGSRADHLKSMDNLRTAVEQRRKYLFNLCKQSATFNNQESSEDAALAPA